MYGLIQVVLVEVSARLRLCILDKLGEGAKGQGYVNALGYLFLITRSVVAL